MNSLEALLGGGGPPLTFHIQVAEGRTPRVGITVTDTGKTFTLSDRAAKQMHKMLGMMIDMTHAASGEAFAQLLDDRIEQLDKADAAEAGTAPQTELEHA